MYLIFLLLIFALSSCAVKNASSTPDSSSALESADSDAVPNSETLITETSDINYYGQTNGTLGVGCAGKNGYYYLLDYGQYYNLMYIDYTSQKSLPVCSRPECAHNDNTCTAYFGTNSGLPEISTNGQSLVLSYPNTGVYNYERYGEEAYASIKIMSLGGSSQKTSVVFPASDNIQSGFACDDAYAYIVKSHTEANGTATALCSVSLDNGSITDLYTFDGTSFIVGADKRNIIVKTFSAPGKNSLYPSDGTQTFSCIDTNTKQCISTEVLPFTNTASSAQTTVEGTTVYCYLPAENSVTVKNLATEEKNSIPIAFSDKAVSYGRLVRVYGNKLVFEELYDGDDNPHMFYVNLDNGQSGTITLNGSYGSDAHSSFPITPSCQTDYGMLVVCRCTAKPINIVDSTGVSFSASALVPQYAFISESDYFASVENFDLIA